MWSGRSEVVCATNRDLLQMVEDGRWRADLYYRINAGVIQLEPLRRRKDEILPLARHFLERASELRGKEFRRIHPDAAALLRDHHWPGNIRELRNAIARAVLFGEGSELTPQHLTSLPKPDTQASDCHESNVFVVPRSGYDIEDLERRLIEDAFRRNNHNQSRTARFLGLSRSKFITRLKQIGASVTAESSS